MFEWKALGAVWPSEQAYQVLELLKQNRIPCRMPADEMFFFSPFHLPRPDRRWSIQVRRQDEKRAMALLAREGLAREKSEQATVNRQQSNEWLPRVQKPSPMGKVAEPATCCRSEVG